MNPRSTPLEVSILTITIKTNVVPVKLIAMIYSNGFFLEKLLNQYFCLETFARIGLYKYTFMDVVVL